MSNTRPIADGLFDWPLGEGFPSLLGSRCKECGETVFPVMRDCPLCGVPDTMESCRLRGTGALEDFIVAERGPAGFAVPYVQAYVRLDDGPVIFTLVTDVDPRSPNLRVGERMNMVFETIATRGEDCIVGWKFRQATSVHG
jgi:uncharacterized OB-fold protein